MRFVLPSLALLFVSVGISALGAGCSAEVTFSGPETDAGADATLKEDPIEEEEKDATPPDPVLPDASVPDATPDATATDPDVIAEEVWVFTYERPGALRYWYCTGTLLSSNRVITAAHCLVPKATDNFKFTHWEIVAAQLPNKPRVTASSPKIFGGSYEDVANPDIGILTLDTPIVLQRYAEPTDVVAQVKAGTPPVLGTAIVRQQQVPQSPFVQSDTWAVTSTEQWGYMHGFGVPVFSKGGDSGAGLFLSENGKATHKLIGIARQPDYDHGVDHFSRFGADFMTWLAGQ